MAVSTRIKARIRLPIAFLLAASVIGSAIVRAQVGQTQQGNGPPPEERFGIQGQHHQLGRDLGQTQGRDLVIDDVVVSTARIAVRYHATGVQSVPFEHINDNPLNAMQGPTLITVVADGKPLLPIEGTQSGERGGASVRGEHVFAWSGGSPKRLVISILRVMGDDRASWNTEVRF